MVFSPYCSSPFQVSSFSAGRLTDSILTMLSWVLRPGLGPLAWVLRPAFLCNGPWPHQLSQLTLSPVGHQFDVIPAAPSDPLVIAMGKKKCSLIIS